jgi:hypothetical protein
MRQDAWRLTLGTTGVAQQSPAVLVKFTVLLDKYSINNLFSRSIQMKMTKAQKKVGKVMGEYKSGTLHSGKGGKVVKNPKQAIAIAMSEAKLPMRGSRTAKNMKSKGMK